MSAIPADAGGLTAELGRGLRRYTLAAHGGRIAVGAIGVEVAVNARVRPTGHRWADVLLTVLALAWIVAVALGSERLLARRPRLVWVDCAVLTALMAANRPWDSLAALPYAAFALLVPYVRPARLAQAVLAVTIASYLPKLALLAAGSAAASHVAPIGATGMGTQYIGLLVGGMLALGLCTLLARVRRATLDHEAAQRALTEAEVRRADTAAQHALADRLHDTISQAVRAIPLRLDVPAPDDLPRDALEIRRQIVGAAQAARPAAQAIARRLRRPVS